MTAREIFWSPDLMMREALALLRLAGRLQAERANRPGANESATAAPVLLVLAAELGLKAWQCRERSGKAPDRTHDLVQLFDGLGDDARSLLERAMPGHPDPLARLSPSGGGIKEALEVNRDLFTTWRYPYEHRGLVAETSALRTALEAIVYTYFSVGPPDDPRLTPSDPRRQG